MAGITLVNPVFVDTSEGKAVIADSLKPNQSTESPKKDIKSKPQEKTPEKAKPVVRNDEKEIDEDKTVEIDTPEVKRGK